MSRRCLRTRDDRYDNVVQVGVANIAPELLERIHQRLAGIVEIGVVEHFATLVFFRSAVVVEREDSAVVLPASQPQVDGRLATVAADFQHRPLGAHSQGVAIERLCLVLCQKAFDGVDVCGEVGDHAVRTVTWVRQGIGFTFCSQLAGRRFTAIPDPGCPVAGPARSR